MNITDVKIRRLLNEGRLRAIVSVTFENAIALHDIKVIEGPNRLFVAMPSRRDENGVFRDIVHPISSGERSLLEQKILSSYRATLADHPVEILPAT